MKRFQRTVPTHSGAQKESLSVEENVLEFLFVFYSLSYPFTVTILYD
jgi:hypothetical protein